MLKIFKLFFNLLHFISHEKNRYRHKYNKIKIYFIFEELKKNLWDYLQRIIELFTQTIVIKLSKIWVWDPGSGIWENLFRIPDPQHCWQVIKKSEKSWNQGRLNFFLFVDGRIQFRTNNYGSGSWWPKSLWILRIRIPNIAKNMSLHNILYIHLSVRSVSQPAVWIQQQQAGRRCHQQKVKGTSSPPLTSLAANRTAFDVTCRQRHRLRRRRLRNHVRTSSPLPSSPPRSWRDAVTSLPLTSQPLRTCADGLSLLCACNVV
jgi:hypothetical protein